MSCDSLPFRTGPLPWDALLHAWAEDICTCVVSITRREICRTRPWYCTLQKLQIRLQDGEVLRVECHVGPTDALVAEVMQLDRVFPKYLHPSSMQASLALVSSSDAFVG